MSQAFKQLIESWSNPDLNNTMFLTEKPAKCIKIISQNVIEVEWFPTENFPWKEHMNLYALKPYMSRTFSNHDEYVSETKKFLHNLIAGSDISIRLHKNSPKRPDKIRFSAMVYTKKESEKICVNDMMVNEGFAKYCIEK